MQNTILCVGPGTPASVLMKPTNLSSSSSSSHSYDEALASDISDFADDDDDIDSGEGNEGSGDAAARGLRRQRWTRRVLQSVHGAQAQADADGETGDEGAGRGNDAAMDELLEEKEAEEESAQIHETTADGNSSGRRRQRSDSARSEHASEIASASGTWTGGGGGGAGDPGFDGSCEMDDLSQNTSSTSSFPRTQEWAARPKPTVTIERPVAPSLRHGGCINTASWLACPWRLSFANHADNTLHGGLIVSSSHSSNSAAVFSLSEQNEDGSGRGRGRLYSVDRNEASNDDAQVRSTVRASQSDECPTQLITSGDDRTVKFWDVSDAMGGTSPFPGGPATICPFSQSPRLYDTPPEVVKHWKRRDKRGDPIPGAVVPLVSLKTGHTGNVFHATPLLHQPGKVATCAADGYMRISDIETGSDSSSTIIVSPDIEDDFGDLPVGLMSLRSSMCFSHHFLDAHGGLLCTERGLKRFDIRLAPREQPSGSVLGGQYTSCKSCAIWSAETSGVGGGIDEESYDSAYVFAGSSSGDVALCDLRMTSDTSSRIVQSYRPSCFGPSEVVSVSGIDVSRDKRELLVSYESDQIYSFPIFPYCSSAAGPSVEELASYSATLAEDDEDEEETSRGLLPEFAAYGGHLNRYTFLKMAKYAGPRDEYICTGSDSGHAWIYEKASGSVVSLLKADHSTCNGIVPHPTLPFFITYGIDSTAKLWRAAQPVCNDVDDSDVGRNEIYHTAEYDASHLVRSWKATQSKLDLFCDTDVEEDNFTLLPDEIPSHDDDFDSIFGGLAGVLFRSATRFGGHSPMIPYIGNDLVALPKVLLQNYFSCVRAYVSGDDEPIRSGIDAFKRRVGLMRLKHQADRLGLKWDNKTPWVMKPKAHVRSLEAAFFKDRDGSDVDLCSEIKYGSNADLVPDFPGDWIPFDAEMTRDPLPFGMPFNDDVYQEFYLERYAKNRQWCFIHQDTSTETCTLSDDFVLSSGKTQTSPLAVDPPEQEGENDACSKASSPEKAMGFEDERKKPSTCRNGTAKSHQDYRIKARPDAPALPYDTTKAWDLLYNTVVVLKEGGNAALSVGAVSLAACRYDKAIRYCAIAFLRFPEGQLSFLSSHQGALAQNGGHEVRWTPLLKALVTTRLNLSMTTLRPEAYSPTIASDQAQLALNEIKPFATSKGKVMIGEMLDISRDEEPEETYNEAKELQAKAFFRLGNAQRASSDYGAAVKSYENSIKSTRDIKGSNAKPEAVVQRRLLEAKKENAKKRMRQRKKFKFAFSNEDGGKELAKDDAKDEDGKQQERQIGHPDRTIDADDEETYE